MNTIKKAVLALAETNPDLAAELMKEAKGTTASLNKAARHMGNAIKHAKEATKRNTFSSLQSTFESVSEAYSDLGYDTQARLIHRLSKTLDVRGGFDADEVRQGASKIFVELKKAADAAKSGDFDGMVMGTTKTLDNVYELSLQIKGRDSTKVERAALSALDKVSDLLE